MFSNLVTSYGLLGTPGDLELKKRTDVNGLNISNTNLGGFVGDIDGDVTCDVVSHGTLLVSCI